MIEQTQTIEVKSDHIKRGKRLVRSECPLAIALKDATGTYWRVSRGYAQNGFILSVNVASELYDLDLEVAAWVCRFDNGAEVCPVKFYLDRKRKMIGVLK